MDKADVPGIIDREVTVKTNMGTTRWYKQVGGVDRRISDAQGNKLSQWSNFEPSSKIYFRAKNEKSQIYYDEGEGINENIFSIGARNYTRPSDYLKKPTFIIYSVDPKGDCRPIIVAQNSEYIRPEDVTGEIIKDVLGNTQKTDDELEQIVENYKQQITIDGCDL